MSEETRRERVEREMAEARRHLLERLRLITGGGEGPVVTTEAPKTRTRPVKKRQQASRDK